MLISLSIPVIIILDFVGWFLLHMSMAYFFTRLPIEYFNPTYWLFKTRNWERTGTLYQALGVKRWKEKLPDGAALFAGGFKKKRLSASNGSYYRRFISETCRGEAAHWGVILCTPVFFIWNYWWANIIMVLYSISANMPCILTQRYNRIRLGKILEKHEKRQ